MISGSIRFLVNVESLNGVETVGNLARHRTAPIVVREPNGDYAVRYVPVVSGESIAHAYQMELARLAEGMGLPVSQLTKSGELIKFADNKVLDQEGIKPPNSQDEARRLEVDVMLKDVVADVGGFLYAGAIPVRRSSRFMVGYMVPVVGKGEIPAQLEAQFHVRYAVATPKEQQAVYNVEVASALYALSFVLDDENIGVPSNPGPQAPNEHTLQQVRKLRIEAAVRALHSLFTGNFGAKRSRFLPHLELMSAVVAVTDFPFVAEPAHSDDYIKRTCERAEKAKNIFNGKLAVVLAINREGLDVGCAKIVNHPEDLIDELLKAVPSLNIP